MFDFVQNCRHTFFMFIWLFVSVAMAQPVPNQRLSCLLDKQEVCAEAEYKLATVTASHFSDLGARRKEEFINWIKSSALYIQALTGMPASVIVAQAAIASEFGTTKSFRESNNIFKQACWQAGSHVSGDFELKGRKFKYRGVCQKEKTGGQVGKLVKFASLEDSFNAYLHFTVALGTRYTKNLLEDLRHGEKLTPPRSSSFRSASPYLAYFATDNSYVGGIQRVIQSEKISTLDNFACWQCIVLAGRPPPPPEPATAPVAPTAQPVAPAPATGGGK